MLSGIFKKTTPEDILKTLKDKTFKESKVNSLLENIDINLKFSNGETFLHKIIPLNNIESVKCLINHKIDLNSKDIEGNTPLHIAAKYEYIDTIKALLNSKADVNLTNEYGQIPIQIAILNGRYDTYRILSEYTKDFNHSDTEGNSLIKDAIRSKNIDIIEDLIENKNVNIDKSIFFFDSIYDDFDIFKKLIQCLDDINSCDEKGRNILFYLVHCGFSAHEELKYLLNKDININTIDEEGNNILLHLIYYIMELSNNKEEKDDEELKIKIDDLMNLVPVLIEENIDTSISNIHNENILTLCIKDLNIKLLNLLLDYDVDPNILTIKNETALTHAALKGNEALDLMYLLLDYGASPNIKDDNNQTIIEKLIDIDLYRKNGKKLVSSKRREIDEKNDYLAILDAILANSEVHLTDYNSKGEPYIFEPMSFGNIYLIKLLVKYGADINQRDKEGLNIIYKYMAENKTFRREIDQKNYYTNLKSIIGLGANVNAKDSYGGITLHKAILDCDINTVKIILHSGADINAVDNRGRNMIHNCMWQNKIKTFRLIYTFNKKLLNEPDKFGVLPINYAAFLGYKDLVIELIRTGSHINNPYRKTPYILNFLKRFHESIGTLEEKALTKAEKSTVKALLDNMKKEFEIDSI